MPRPKGRSNRPHPAVLFESAMQVAQAITENNAGRPMNRLLLAEVMEYSPSSSGFRDRITSASKYGLTEGNFHSDTITLTDLGVAVTRPRNDHERVEAQRKAMRSVPIFADLLEHFANNKLPRQDFLKNTLERDPFNIDPVWSDAVAEAFADDARYVGYLRDIGGARHIVLDGSATAPEIPANDVDGTNYDVDKTPAAVEEAAAREAPRTEKMAPTEVPRDRPVPMQLFIAHGKSRKPLEQLKRILDDWKVPYLVAVDEPNAGRPISAKVAETMHQCSAGIFIFTADEQLKNRDNEIVSRPSENVVYELGAASLLYGRKIVILKEVGVSFPSDFRDLGWIEFEEDALDAKALDLLREMIALEALKLVSTAGL